MSEEPKTPVEPPVPNPVDNEPKDNSKSVSYESHRKLLDEKKKLAEQLKSIQDTQKAEQEAKLIEDGKLKEALELKEKELKEQIDKNLAFENRHKQAKKLSAIMKGMGTQIDDKWLSVIQDKIDNVSFLEDGSVDKKTVESTVNDLKKQWPEMIETSTPKMPNGKPSGTPSTITRSEWLKLSSSEMMKWKPDQII